MNRFCLIFFSLSLTLVFAEDSPLILNDDFPVGQSWVEVVSDRNSPLMTFTTRASNEIYEQDTELLIPLLMNQDGSRFLFSSITHNFRDNGANNLSGGLFYRFDVPNLNSIFGLSIHGDTTETDYHNQIEQFGFGFDMFTKSGVDFHGNLYFDDGDQYRVGTAYGDPFARGFGIFQHSYGIVEQGLSGGDFRVAFPLPIPNIDLPARGFVGGYTYDGAADDISGFMAGLDIYPFQGVGVGAEYFADREFYGDNWVFKAGVTIPLDNVFNVKDWQKGLSGVLAPSSHDRNSFEVRSRMAGPRRNWVLSELSVQNAPYATGNILSDVVFVNNGDAVGNGIKSGSRRGNGSAERPANTIQRGANLVSSAHNGNGTVYVQGDRRYRETVEVGSATLQGSDAGATSRVRFTSSFKPIYAAGDRMFGGDTSRPVVNGGFFFSGVNGLRSAEVTGFDIRRGNSIDGHGISSDEVSNFLATCNLIQDTLSDGINVQNVGGGNATTIIFDNRFRRSGADAIEIDHVVGPGKESRILVWGNLARNQSDGVEIEVDGTDARSMVTVADNEFLNNRDQGIDLAVILDSGSRGDVVVSGNRVNNTTGSEGAYIGLEAYGGSRINLLMDANKIQKTVNSDGAYVYFEASGGSQMNGVITNNVFRGAKDDALTVSDNSADDDSNIGLTIAGNQFLNSEYGLYLETDWNGGMHTANVSNNVAKGNRSDGFYIEIDVDDAGSAELNFDSNIAAGNGESGAYVYFDVSGGSSAVGRMRNNLFRNNSDVGLEVYDNSVSDDSTMVLVITGNEFLRNGGDGFQLETDWDDSTFSVRIANNIARGNRGDGFEIDIDSDDENASIPLVISGNTFLNNGDDSIELEIDSDAGVVVSGSGNFSSGAGSGNALNDAGTGDATGSFDINGMTISFPNPGDVAD